MSLTYTDVNKDLNDWEKEDRLGECSVDTKRPTSEAEGKKAGETQTDRASDVPIRLGELLGGWKKETGNKAQYTSY